MFTQAQVDAIVARATEEAKAIGRAMAAKADAAELEAKEFRDKLRASNKSLEAGKWKSNIAVIAWCLVLFVFGVLVGVGIGTARASDPTCAKGPPPDLHMLCHAESGMWVLDSDALDKYVTLGLRCARQI